MKKLIFLLIILLASFFDSFGQAKVQFIHNDTSLALASIDLYVVSGTSVTFIDDFNYKTASVFLNIAHGNNLKIGIAPVNSASISDTIKNFTTSFNLSNNTNYYIIFNNGNFKLFGGFNLASGATGQINLAFYHGAKIAEVIDLQYRTGIANNTLIFDNTNEFSFNTNIVTLPTNNFVFRVSDENQFLLNEPTFRRIASCEVNFSSFSSFQGGTSALVFTSGTSQGIGAYSFSVMCVLPFNVSNPSSQKATVLSLPLLKSALVQIVNTSPDADSVQVFVNNDVLGFSGTTPNTISNSRFFAIASPSALPFQGATPYFEVDWKTNVDATFVVKDKLQTTELLTQSFTLVNGSENVILLGGSVANLELYKGKGSRISNSGIGSNKLGITVFNGSPDISAIDVSITAPIAAATTLGTNISFGEFATYTEAPFVSSQYTVQVSATGGGPIFQSTPLTIAFNPQHNGLGFTFFFTGYENPIINNNGKLLQICYASLNGNPAPGRGNECFDLLPIGCNPISITNNIVKATSQGISNGSINLTINNGTAPYQYYWSNGATTQNINNLSTGNYSVTVIDANNCPKTSSFFVGIVNDCNIFNLVGDITYSAFQGTSNGSINLNVNNGTAPYQFSWSNGSTTQNINNLSTGNYSVTVIDANNCSSSNTFFIDLINCSVPNIVETFTSCGTVTLTASGGTTYVWSGGSSINTATNTFLSNGNYTVTVSENNGCIDSVSYTVVISPQIVVNGFTVGCDSVSLEAVGGVSYLWSGGSSINSARNTFFNSGDYTVTVLDSNGCSSTDTATVTVNATIIVNINPPGITTICFGDNQTLTASNAISYLWNTGATTQSITVGNNGNYNVTATDSNNCVSSASANINVDNFTSQAIIGNPSITPFQAYPYLVNNISGNTYNWVVQNGAIQSGQGTNNINVIWGGNGPYSVTLIESNGLCTDTSTLLIANSNCTLPVNVIISGTNPACQGDTVLLIAQSNAGVNFSWSKDGNALSNQTNDTLKVTAQGSYQVQATSGGCTVLSNATFVSFNPSPQIPIIQASNIQNTCNVQPVILSLNNTYNSYLWSNGATTAATTVSVSGNYSVTITDNNNCKAISPPISVNLALIPPAEICIVSVDSVTGKNVIVWEKGNIAEIDSFIIYKETNQFNVFNKIGAASKAVFSTFVDQNSNPQQNAERYTIAALDTCGNVTVQSSPHKTIHLTINQGQQGSWNLLWNHYEGFNYLTYNIYRGTNGNNLSQIASISAGNNSYSDLTPPAGLLFYQIEAVHPTGCTPTAKRQTGYNSTKSNIVDNNEISVDVINILNDNAVTIYPNPTQENFVVSVESKLLQLNNSKVMVYDMQGRLIEEKPLVEKETKFSLKEYNNGIYLIRIQTEVGGINKRLVKQ